MNPRFVDRPEMIIVGIVGCSSDVSEMDIYGLWQRFEKNSRYIKHQIAGKGYEVHIQEDTAPVMHFCLAGVEVQKIEDLPLEFFAKTIPASRYAVFTHYLKDGGFGEAFKAVYDWLKESEYAAAYPFDIQCYDERFKGQSDPESVIEIYIPIVSGL